MALSLVPVGLRHPAIPPLRYTAEPNGLVTDAAAVASTGVGGSKVALRSGTAQRPRRRGHPSLKEHVNLKELAPDATRTDQRGPAASALVIGADSAAWQRRLGPLAWMALQHLALSSHRSEAGWAAAVGVRDIAAGIAVTKDTAARAVSALISAGLLTRARVEALGGHRRSGYLVQLPQSMWLVDCLNKPEGHPMGPTGGLVGDGRRGSGNRLDRDPPASTTRNRRRSRSVPADDQQPPGAPSRRPSWDQPPLFDTRRNNRPIPAGPHGGERR
jgi:DNA-binding MarR family transcriptional regulator